jgi:hypothetical protein
MTGPGLGKSTGVQGAKLGAANEEGILLKGSQKAVRHKGRRKRVANGGRRAVRDDFILKVAVKGFKAIMQATGEGEQKIPIREVDA